MINKIQWQLKALLKDKNRLRLTIMVILALGLFLVSLGAAYLTPYDPYEQNLSNGLSAPSPKHFFGTDRYGRDLFSRILVGSSNSILGAVALAIAITVLGSGIGIVAAVMGGWLDRLLMTGVNVFLSFPSLVLAIAVAGTLEGGLHNAMLALLLIGWPKYARLARSQVLLLKDRPWLQAAKMAGSNQWQLIYRHILPNIFSPLMVTCILDIGTLMMELSALSYLGLGARPPLAEWGSMISEGRSLMTSHPWLVLGPGAAIFLTVIIFNLLGDTYRDYLDPHSWR